MPRASPIDHWHRLVISCSCGIKGLSALRYELSVVGLLTGVSRERSQLIRKAWSAGGVSTLDCRGIVKTPWAAVFMGGRRLDFGADTVESRGIKLSCQSNYKMLVYAKCLLTKALSLMGNAWFYQFLYESVVARVDVCVSGNKIRIYSISAKIEKTCSRRWENIQI